MLIFEENFDLEKALFEDTEGSTLRLVKDGLQEGLHTTRKNIDKGLSPDDFTRAQALKQAFEAAEVVVETSWKNYRLP